MAILVFILVIIASSSTITYGRSLRSPNPLIPFLLSSDVDDHSITAAPELHSEDRSLEVTEHIIKYVSKIKSSEDFIDDIINHQKQVVNKMKILQFLNKCFQVTDEIIQREIHRLSNPPNPNKKSLTSSPFTLEELQEAQHKIHNLLDVIRERIAILKAWIPPTMPFLSF